MLLNIDKQLYFAHSNRAMSNRYRKVQTGNDQEKAQSQRNSHSKNRGGKN